MKAYIGIKNQTDKYGGANFGDIWLEQEDGSYTCSKYPGKVLSQNDINEDVMNGYVQRTDLGQALWDEAVKREYDNAFKDSFMTGEMAVKVPNRTDSPYKVVYDLTKPKDGVSLVDKVRILKPKPTRGFFQRLKQWIETKRV